MAQWYTMPTLHILFDPIIRAQVVESVGGLGKVAVGGGETGRLHLRLQDAGEFLEVSGQLFRAVVAIEEIHHGLRPVSSAPCQADGLEAEALDELQYSFVIVINEFAAPFGDHAIAPAGRIGVHSTADAIGSFIEAA